MKIGIVMDPIESINFKKDSTLAIMLEAQSRSHSLFYMTPNCLFIKETGAHAITRRIEVKSDPENWFSYEQEEEVKLTELDVIFMRQDPPFNSNYIYNTYVLESAEKEGVLVINKPNSLRSCNEKVFATEFPQCCTSFLVSSEELLLKKFISENMDTVVKPLDGMGGSSIFRVKVNDPNLNVILETITNFFSTKVMIQKYIPEIVEGDKRILLINGKAMNAAIARVPAEGELRGNLAAGATAVARSLTERDIWICDQVGPQLSELGLTLVGLDVIGDYLTEINVTSPTCFKEYESLCDIDVAKKFLESVESQLQDG
ncbi:MAG: glutathione synthase [Gammaproteobacteria bacterium]|nr:glutathione synthase [Gammaproteobacteria bacterium]HJM59592.1 glutathione synthase [SAR86 cluster bacterium]|tara:strand:- start:826 stop:1773 length:948 start_codon:yes stop_codon:yes gene_type:complete